jgi:hypothetical protein
MDFSLEMLFMTYSIYWLTLLILAIKSKNWKLLKWNLLIHIIYSVIFIIGAGMAEGWTGGTLGVLWILTIIWHWFNNFITLLISVFKRNDIKTDI